MQKHQLLAEIEEKLDEENETEVDVELEEKWKKRLQSVAKYSIQ